MKDRIIMFIIGLLVGAVLASAAFYVYTITNKTNTNTNTQTNNQQNNQPPKMQDGQPPEMPNDKNVVNPSKQTDEANQTDTSIDSN